MTLNIVSSFNGVSDPDAAAYIEAVEAADGQLLEFGVGKAINDFVVGCKFDGIWDAIKASCILAGARTLSGALVPLKGTAPTNYNFVAGDYDRKTGLVGDGSTKYLDSNRNNNADPQNSKHLSVYATTVSNANQAFAAARKSSVDNTGQTSLTSLSNGATSGRANAETPQNGASLPINSSTFIGVARLNSTQVVYRIIGTNYTGSITSQTPAANSTGIFARKSGTVFDAFTASRFSFYSIGEALDLALLDSRVTNLITAFGAAIP